jgi:hypothetical protein
MTSTRTAGFSVVVTSAPVVGATRGRVVSGAVDADVAGAVLSCFVVTVVVTSASALGRV